MKSKYLAVFGGDPVASEPLVAPAWPVAYDDTADRLVEIYRSGKWSFGGPEELTFAQDFADYHGATYGVFMINGTVTLEAALEAHGIGPGDEVLVPGITWMATAMAVHYVGATPVFVDVEPTTFCLDPQKVSEAITSRTRAMMPVHLYGSMADMDALMAIADEHDLVVIEDCAHAHGGKWAGRGVGSIGHVGSFSFQQSKSMASGEGGICITNDEEIAETLYRIKHIGYAPNAAQGKAASGPPEGLVCHNYRATEFQAAILSGQLARLEDRMAMYNRKVDRIRAAIEAAPGMRMQSPGRLADPQSYYGVLICFDQEPLADVPNPVIHRAINAEGLPTAWTFRSVQQDMLYNVPRDSYRVAPGGTAVSDHLAISRTALLLHQWLLADDDVIDTICEILRKVGENSERLVGIESVEALA